jgi:hypothetical protein
MLCEINSGQTGISYYHSMHIIFLLKKINVSMICLFELVNIDPAVHQGKSI